jgi:RNA polymerase sigma-70 factor, ECF subfamily
MLHFADDLRLTRQMLAGERAAFDGFFAANFPRLFRFVLMRVGQRTELAEDLVQETLCKALRSLAGYRGEASLFTWLCQIARNVIADHWRANPQVRAPKSLTEDDPAIAAALASLASESAANPEAQRASQELARLVQVALDALPGHYADALEWKYIEGQSVADIAGRLQQTPVQVQSLLARARQAFRDAFQALTVVSHG